MIEHPEAWAGHAAEFWLAEGEHPADAAHAAQITASVRGKSLPGTGSLARVDETALA
jgi:hypothetical protein